MTKVLLVGGESKLAKAMLLFGSQENNITLGIRNLGQNKGLTEALNIDISNEDTYQNIKPVFDYVIICGGITDYNTCQIEENPIWSITSIKKRKSSYTRMHNPFSTRCLGF